jgi:hypothetical protein
MSNKESNNSSGATETKSSSSDFSANQKLSSLSFSPYDIMMPG